MKEIIKSPLLRNMTEEERAFARERAIHEWEIILSNKPEVDREVIRERMINRRRSGEGFVRLPW